MATYRLSPEAEDDLYRIWIYGAERFGVKQADKYFRAFFHVFGQIADGPYQYPSVDHIRPGYLRAVSGVDSIYYQVKRDIVEIMAIIGRQDANSKLSRFK